MANFKVSMWRLVRQTFELEIECDTEQDAKRCARTHAEWEDQEIKDRGIEVVKLPDEIEEIDEEMVEEED